jgi:putative Holliday junction resolvase
MTRYLGIDFGSKRIGLAIGDDTTGIASPVETIEVAGTSDTAVRSVLSVAEEYGTDAFVVGLPLNMDGTEGRQAKLTRAFCDALTRSSELPVLTVDERLSSHAADELLRPAELTRGKKKKRQDAVAAVVILQSYFERVADLDVDDD